MNKLGLTLVIIVALGLAAVASVAAQGLAASQANDKVSLDAEGSYHILRRRRK